MGNLYSIVSRVFFTGAFGLFVLAGIERLANGFGYTILRGKFAPGRLLEFAAVLLIFVITLLVRDVRDAARKTPT